MLLTEHDLETHVHGVGGTRSGKSKLIESVAREFLRRGQGFCLIDPHGSLYEDLVTWLSYLAIPRKDVVLFNPSSTSRIVGFSPFTRGDQELTARVNRLIRATVKAWGATDTDETPRLERWLRCIYHTLLEGGHSFDIVEYLLTWATKAEREFLTSKLSVELIRNEWESLAAYNKAVDFDNQLESTRNRLFRFLHAKQIRRVMGLSSNAIDVGRIIEDGKVLLVNLQPSEVLSAEQGELIGTLLLDEIWHHTQRRQRKQNPFFLVIDEFQKYLTPDIPDMLDEAAKRGVHLLLFHQRLDQLRMRDAEAYSAVMTNARTKLVFGALSREDARTMVQEIFPGQVDLLKVKYTIEQTKFWPHYARDVVRYQGSGTGLGAASGMAIGLRSAWDPETGTWIESPSLTETQTETQQASETEGTADIPVLLPEAFKETTGVQLFTLEELLWQLADQLMLQYQRHFMIRRPGYETMAAVTPYVRSWSQSPEVIARYTEQLLAGFPTPEEVDRELQLQRERLRTAAVVYAEQQGPRIVPSSVPRRRRVPPTSDAGPES